MILFPKNGHRTTYNSKNNKRNNKINNVTRERKADICIG